MLLVYLVSSRKRANIKDHPLQNGNGSVIHILLELKQMGGVSVSIQCITDLKYTPRYLVVYKFFLLLLTAGFHNKMFNLSNL